jgi:hypothetical protein
MPRSKLPDDVKIDQVWKGPDGQHFKVASVINGVAELQRATPAGRVLNQRFRTKVSVERMQTDWAMVSDR